MNNAETKKFINASIPTSIAPWFSVKNGVQAIDFYKSAFSAIETYRLDAPDGGVVSKLSVDGAEFWLSGESPDNLVIEEVAGSPIRMILTVTDPDALFKQAINAGATEVFPVGEDYGWRLGRIVDPFGHHWEIGRPLDT